MGFFRTLIGWVSGRDRREFQEAMTELRRQVFEVPLDDAKQEVSGHLSDPAKFQRLAATSDLVLPRSVEALPPLVTEFFSMYDAVEEHIGFVRLSRSAIAKSLIDNRYVRIGTGAEHSEVVVIPNAEDVYVTDWSEHETGDGSLDRYPTLYHFLLFRVRFLHPTGRIRW